MEQNLDYKRLANDLNIGFYKIDSEGIILEHNCALNKIFGFPSDKDLKNLKLTKYWKHSEKVKEFIERLKYNTSIHNFSAYMEKISGEKIVIKLTTNCSIEPKTQEFIVEGMIEDITDIYNLEKRLQESERKYKELVLNIKDLILKMNLEGEILYVSPQCKELMGYRQNELLNTNIFGYIIPKDQQKIKTYLDKNLIESKDIELETQIKHKKKKFIPVSIKGSVNFEDNLFVITALISDISNRKKAEESLKESEEKFRAITEQSSIGIFIIQDGKFKSINRQYAKIFGYTLNEIERFNTDKFLNLIYPRDRTLVSEQMNNVMKKQDIKEPYTFEFRALNRDKDVIWVQATAKSIHYRGKSAILVSIVDITKKKQVELRLKNSEKKFRTIADNALIGIEIIQDNKIIYINDALTSNFGFNKEEILFKDVREFFKIIHPEDRDLIGEQVNKKQKGAEDVLKHYEFRAFTKDGKMKWIDCHSDTIEIGNKPSILTMMIDITEKKKFENKIRKSEEQFRELFNEFPIGVTLINLSGKVINCNTRVEEIYGVSKSNLINKNLRYFQNFIVKEYLPRAVKAFENALKGKKSKPREIKVVHRDGSEFWIYFYIRKVILSDQDLYLVISQDITDLKETQKHLIQSEKKFRTLFEEALNPIFIVNKEGYYEDLNKAASNFLEEKREIIIGKNVFDHTPIQQKESDIKKHSPFYSRRTLETDYYIHGKIKTLLLNIVPFTFRGQKLLYGIGQDITDRNEIEQKLKQSQKKYKKAYNVANFYKNLYAHDMNNILQNISSAIELSNYYSEIDNVPGILEMLEIVKEQVYRGNNLVSNVRKLSKLEEKDISLKIINLCEILEKAIRHLKRSFPTKKINIHIESFSSDIKIQANELLYDVFENILINAVNYNQKKSIEIWINLSIIKYGQNKFVKMEFKDNGIGITDSKKKVIFKEGFQEQKGQKGLGFGLSLVKRIVENYKGKIWVEDRVKNKYYKGANFVLVLPLEKYE